MEPLAAVVTTGIYCRPGCAGRPLRANVRPFGHAAAAEAAGFRACLRCRPYREAQPASWSGPELVCRAVQLIMDGALDDGSESQLGARLGVSGRHLRRLFGAELGVTPDGLARSRRTHFGRRLLDDTDLTITEVAFAAGFGSTRQFNRDCRAIFGASPRELRARRRAPDRLVADGGLRLRLPYRGAVDWHALVTYLAPRCVPGVESVDGTTYRRTVVIDGDPGVLELTAGPDDGDPPHLLLTAHLPHWEGLIHVAGGARRIANLDADHDSAISHLGDDPLLGPLVRARPGLRVAGTWDPFETGVRVIVGQQVSVVTATRLTGRLVARLGTPVGGLAPLGLTHTFPPAQALAEADLSGLGLTGSRARAVRTFAEAVADDRVRLDRSLGLDQLARSITELPGLGDWTAQHVALRLGEPDAFPATDLGLRRALTARGAGDGEGPDRWRPWRALGAAHLWATGAGGGTPLIGRRTPS